MKDDLLILHFSSKPHTLEAAGKRNETLKMEDTDKMILQNHLSQDFRRTES